MEFIQLLPHRRRAARGRRRTRARGTRRAPRCRACTPRTAARSLPPCGTPPRDAPSDTSYHK